MAALIAWICRVDHHNPNRRDYLPNLTLNHGEWAYCPQGGTGDHAWMAIEPAPIEMVRVRHHASEESAIEEVRAK